MTDDPPSDDEPPAATAEDYGAPEVPAGEMLTSEGLVDALPEQQINGEDVTEPGMPSKMITKLLWDHERLKTYEPVPREWVVPGCIPCGEVCLLTGPGGLGKSTLAIMLQVALASEKVNWLEYPTMPAVASLGLYAEEDHNELARRFQGVRRRLGVDWADMPRVLYAPLKGKEVLLTQHNVQEGWVDPTPVLNELHELISRFEIRLAVLDSLNRMFASNENDRPMVTGFCRNLEAVATETGCAILLLGHPSKSAMVDGSGYSGSTAWDSMVRARAFLSYVVEPDPEMLSAAEKAAPLLRLSWKKGNYAARSPDIELQISFDEAASAEEPPIFAKIPDNLTDNRELFLTCVDDLNAKGIWPRTSAKGTSKSMYAPSAVYKHALNKGARGKKQMTSEQCQEIYRSLMTELGLLRVVFKEDGRRHKIECVERVPQNQPDFDDKDSYSGQPPDSWQPQGDIPF